LDRQRTQGAPTLSLPARIQAEARRLAKDYVLAMSDEHRAAACLDRLVRAFDPALADRPTNLRDALRRPPLLLLSYAAQSFGFDRAAQLIERSDLHSLWRFVRVAEYLFGEETPFYTVDELASYVGAFSKFLKAHRSFLVATGLPPKCFRPSRWLYLQLGRLYDTRCTKLGLSSR
jgi:hypothetical protein